MWSDSGREGLAEETEGRGPKGRGVTQGEGKILRGGRGTGEKGETVRSKVWTISLGVRGSPLVRRAKREDPLRRVKRGDTSVGVRVSKEGTG